MRNSQIVATFVVFALLGITTNVNATSPETRIAEPATVGVLVIGVSAGWRVEVSVDTPGLAAQHTILDVFTDPVRGFVAESKSTSTVPASLDLGPYLENRPMRLVVRSDHQTQARFQVAVRFKGYRPENSAPVYDKSYTFVVQNTSGGTVDLSGGLAARTHFQTAMPPMGSNDTLLMLLTDGEDAMVYDDDLGPGMMSVLDLPEMEDHTSACPAGGTCSLLVANVVGLKEKATAAKGRWTSNVAELAPLMLYVDEDVHNGRDGDNDGLGDALEQALGTHWKGRYASDTDCPIQEGDTNNTNGCTDTDRDGVSDVLEVYGMRDLMSPEESNPWSLVMFPSYGADPKQKDVFVETHWKPFCPGPRCQNKDLYQFNSAQIDNMRTRWAPVRVHFDTGPAPIPCIPPEFCGNWGGAYMYSDGYNPSGYCDGLSDERRYFFHHLYSDGGNGGQTSPGSKCSVVNNRALGVPAHELGHQFGLLHFGGPDSADEVSGCKPHYVSIMSYVYQEYVGMGSTLPGFSKGLNNIVLNPTRLDETTLSGISTAHPYVTAISDMFGRKYQAGVGIDWNFDGQISTSGTVQGPINYPTNYANCDREASAVRLGGWVMQASDPILVSTGTNLWMVARKGSKELLAARATIKCAEVQGTKNCTEWTNRTGISTGSVELESFAPAGAGEILVVVSKGGKGLYYIKRPPWVPNIIGPSNPIPVVRGPQPDDGQRIWGSPAATEDPSTKVVSVYAAAGPVVGDRHLARWDYDPRTRGWTRIAEIQYYDSGDPIVLESTVGPGLTRGYQEGGLVDSRETQGEFVYLALAVKDKTSGGRSRATVLRQVTATWEDPPVQYWTELPSPFMNDLNTSLGATLEPPADTRLGLAFRPEDRPSDQGPGIFRSGRFYLTFLGNARKTPAGTPYHPRFSMTQGNVFWDGTGQRPTEREMVLLPYNGFANEWSNWEHGSIFLSYHKGNVRGAARIDLPVDFQEVFDPDQETRLAPPNVSFFPNADGVLNQDQHDHDDQSLIANEMNRSLNRVVQ